MTREEAIKELSYIADEMPSMECRDWKEAIQMAIKALEQEPCGDCISRQAAIDTIWAHATKILERAHATESSDYDIFFQDIYKMAHRHIAELIQSLPPVKPQPKTGHWIYQHDSFSEWNGFTLYFKCSECGRQIEINSDGKEKLHVIYPFCHCGADMRTRAESEE